MLTRFWSRPALKKTKFIFLWTTHACPKKNTISKKLKNTISKFVFTQKDVPKTVVLYLLRISPDCTSSNNTRYTVHERCNDVGTGQESASILRRLTNPFTMMDLYQRSAKDPTHTAHLTTYHGT